MRQYAWEKENTFISYAFKMRNETVRIGKREHVYDLWYAFQMRHVTVHIGKTEDVSKF